MARGRQTKSAALDKMIRVLQTVNALSPHDVSRDADPICLDEFARLAGMTAKECRRVIDKINYGCGDVIPAAWVELDEQGMVHPHRLNFAFDGLLRLNRPEALALLIALRSSGADGDGHLASLVRGALPDIEGARLDTVLGQSTMPVGALETLAEAIAGSEVVEFDYLDAKNVRTHRAVEPCQIWYDSTLETWSVSAWCRLRQAMRVFRVDRMLSVPAATGQTFTPKDIQAPTAGQGSLGQTVQAVLAVHDPAVLAQDAWPGLEELAEATPAQLAALSEQELAHGAFVAQIPWQAESAWLVQQVVASLGAVEALAPARLREDVRAHARTLLERLG